MPYPNYMQEAGGFKVKNASHVKPSRSAFITAKLISLVSPSLARKYYTNAYNFKKLTESLHGGFGYGSDYDIDRHSSYVRGYDAGQLYGANQQWIPPLRISEDRLVASDGIYTRARARDLVRNNGYVSGAIRRIVNNTIHQGIRLQVNLENKELSMQIEQAWKDWCKRVNFWNIEKISVRHLIMDGEIYHMRYVRRDLMRENIVPLFMKAIEADQLDSSAYPSTFIQDGDNVVRNGIVYNKHDEPIAYYVYPEHLGDYWQPTYGIQEAERIPAKNIIHLFDPIRAAQGRGMSAIASIIMNTHDLNELTSSELVAARIMSAFGIFVTAPYEVDVQSYGAIAGNDNSYDKFRETMEEESRYLEHGRIQYLPAGADVKQIANNRPSPNFDSVSQVINRESASGFGQDYESYSSDYRGSSYSSARSASLETRRGYEVLSQLVTDKIHDPVFEWFITLGKMSGVLPASVPDEVPHTWITRGWAWIDPLKDISAKEREITLGITSRTEVAAAQGKDFEEVLQQLQREKELMEEMGITGASNNDSQMPTDEPEEEGEEAEEGNGEAEGQQPEQEQE